MVLMLGKSGYPYWTVLKEAGEEGYIDLQTMRVVGLERNPSMISYVAVHVEPFGNYYYKYGSKNTFLSRRQALSEGKSYYDEIHAKYYPCLTNEVPKQKILDLGSTTHSHVQQ